MNRVCRVWSAALLCAAAGATARAQCPTPASYVAAVRAGECAPVRAALKACPHGQHHYNLAQCLMSKGSKTDEPIACELQAHLVAARAARITLDAETLSRLDDVEIACREETAIARADRALVEGEPGALERARTALIGLPTRGEGARLALARVEGKVAEGNGRAAVEAGDPDAACAARKILDGRYDATARAGAFYVGVDVVCLRRQLVHAEQALVLAEDTLAQGTEAGRLAGFIHLDKASKHVGNFRVAMERRAYSFLEVDTMRIAAIETRVSQLAFGSTAPTKPVRAHADDLSRIIAEVDDRERGSRARALLVTAAVSGGATGVMFAAGGVSDAPDAWRIGGTVLGTLALTTAVVGLWEWLDAPQALHRTTEPSVEEGR